MTRIWRQVEVRPILSHYLSNISLLMNSLKMINQLSENDKSIKTWLNNWMIWPKWSTHVRLNKLNQITNQHWPSDSRLPPLPASNKDIRFAHRPQATPRPRRSSTDTDLNKRSNSFTDTDSKIRDRSEFRSPDQINKFEKKPDFNN